MAHAFLLVLFPRTIIDSASLLQESDRSFAEGFFFEIWGRFLYFILFNFDPYKCVFNVFV